MKSFGLFLFSFLSVSWLQKFWHAIYLLGLAGMGYGYGINHLPHAKKIAYKKLGYTDSNKDFIVFDVGANIGQTICEIQDLHLSHVKIFSFEPQKIAFQELKNRFENVKNVSLFPFALGKESGEVTFFRSEDADTSASTISPLNSKYLIEEKIPVQTIDNFLKEHNLAYVSYLKMDIEGAEFDTLQGAKESVANGKIEAIEFEFLFKNLDAHVNFRDFWNLLSPQYEIYRILPRSITRIDSYSHFVRNLLFVQFSLYTQIIFLFMKQNQVFATLFSQLRYALFGFHSSFRYKIGYLFASFGKLFDILRGKSIKNRFPFAGKYIIKNLYGTFEILEPSDMHGILSPFSEQELHKEFLSAKSGVVLDIGANIGKYSIFLAPKHEKVFSIEANPQVVKFLQKNMTLNNVKNMIIFPKGIGKSGTCSIAIPQGNNFGSGSFDAAVLNLEIQEKIDCEIVSFSDFVQETGLDITRVRLIKIDTEGAEYDIITSMKPSLKDMHDIKMIVEIWDKNKQKIIAKILEEYGFAIKAQYGDNVVFVKR